MKKTKQLLACLITASFTLIGCGGSDGNPPTTSNVPASPSVVPATTVTPIVLPDPATPVETVQVPVFAEGELSADITRTTFGVPHITANTLEELAFGSAYAQAEDHLCILADGFVKANSQRSQYFGPHASINIATGVISAADNGNLISDFGYLATGIRAAAEANIDTLPDRSRAMLNGFAAGYNKYLADMPSNATPNLPCAGQAWVQPIEGVDLLTYMYSIALLPGSANFFDLMFFANPGDGAEYLPRLAVGQKVSAEADAVLKDITNRAIANEPNIQTPERNPQDLGSNGWGLGGAVTDNGKGMVLGNPHFPHTGQIRFFQSHLTIPGYMDVTGGALIGMPGAVNIGFNQNVAWTHTFSTAEHFVVYQLTLKPEDRETYIFDSQELPVTKQTAQIMVNVGTAVVPFEKDIYVTARGPMIEAPPTAAPFGWDDTQAFYIQDANAFNNDVLEHWLSMNLARNLAEFQKAFKDFDGLIFNNTLYADDQGYAWYMDDSTVPNLTIDAETGVANDPTLAGLRAQAGFTVLPGSSSIFGFTDAEPYENAPKLLTTNYVQNSNDSFWLTNANAPINSYVSPLYGQTQNVQTLRSRMGHKLLTGYTGEDGLFSAAEVESALLSNGSYFADLVLPATLEQCAVQGSDPVMITPATSVDLSAACDALSRWNGAQNADSVGGALLREFAFEYCENSRCYNNFTVPFSASNPTMTPRGVPTDGSALAALAVAAKNLENSGRALDSTLGEVQFVEKSLPDGSPSGAKIPWSGSHSREGGFNVYAYNYDAGRDGTLLPHHTYDPITAFLGGGALDSGLTRGGYHVRYGSSWMMVVQFTDEGPQGRGLLTFSQSNNVLSDHWNDQTLYFAQNNSLRPILFGADEIAANTLTSKTITSD